MEKLTSHKDYENEIDKTELSDADFRLLSRKHREFISKPLELGQFVPCVDNVPFEFNKSPYEDLCDKESVCRVISKEEIKYNKAKENVLFEGFQYSGHSKEHFILEYEDGIYWIDSSDTIEGLIDNFIEPLTLTESAKQQLK
jgi:hypothetical protein